MYNQAMDDITNNQAQADIDKAEYITAKDAAEMLACTIDAIYKAGRRGNVRTIAPQGRLFNKNDLVRHFKKEDE